MSPHPFLPLPTNLVFRNVLVGCGAASFWRGAWYILDDHLYPDTPSLSALSSLGLGSLGMWFSQGLVARGIRYGGIYCTALSCVLVWRGAWLGWDCFYESLHNHHHDHVGYWLTASKSSFLHHGVYKHMPLTPDDEEKTTDIRPTVEATDPGHATKSGFVSHAVACGFLISAGVFASVLAPPAAASVLRDANIVRSTVVAAANKASTTTTSMSTTTSHHLKKSSSKIFRYATSTSKMGTMNPYQQHHRFQKQFITTKQRKIII